LAPKIADFEREKDRISRMGNKQLARSWSSSGLSTAMRSRYGEQSSSPSARDCIWLLFGHPEPNKPRFLLFINSCSFFLLLSFFLAFKFTQFLPQNSADQSDPKVPQNGFCTSRISYRPSGLSVLDPIC
jgi:hypothetical protein